MSNDHAWEALQRNLPAINAAGLQLSASAGMSNASVNVNNSYGQPQPIGASPSAAVAAAPRTSYDPLQAAGIQLSAANLLATAATPNNNINPQPHQTFIQSQQQTPAPSPVNCAVPGGFQTIQSVPATQTAAGTTQTQHPYILIKPQHTIPTATVPNNLPPGTSLHPLLFSPASLFVAGTQQVVPGQVPGQQPQSILPAAISQQPIYQSHPQSQSNKRSLELLPSISASGSGTVMMNEIAPSIVSSTTGPTIARGVTNRLENQKRQRGGGGGSQTKIQLNEELTNKGANPGEKRRFERNLREQQRSSKISSQIKELRELLSECNVPFKPNKYSILLKVVEYIKQLQSRAIMLDSEHQKLITTVRQTNEMIANSGGNNSGMLSTTTGGTDNESSDTMCVENDWRRGEESNEIGSPSQDSELFFVKGIDYRSVFDQCTTALGIAALDGRILECNAEFQSLLGYATREDLLKQSLFNLVHNHQDIFRAMAQMLKTAEEPPAACRGGSNSNDSGRNIDIQEGNTSTMNNDSPTIIESKDRFWTGPVTSKQNIQLSMNITLTSGDNGTPKFFSCALTNSTS